MSSKISKISKISKRRNPYSSIPKQDDGDDEDYEKKEKASTYLLPIQKEMLKGVVFHLFFQMCLLLAVVMIGHHYLKTYTCLFTCESTWKGFAIYILLAIVLLLGNTYGSPSKPFDIFVRTSCFYGLGLLLSYVMLITYNMVLLESKTPEEEEWVKNSFYIAMGMTIGFFLLLLLFLPWLIQNLQTLGFLTGIFFFILIIMTIMILFVNINKNQKLWTVYLVLALVIFVVFTMFDLANVISRCKKPDTLECRSEVGATSIYIDLVNVLQKVFLLLNNNH